MQQSNETKKRVVGLLITTSVINRKENTFDSFKGVEHQELFSLVRSLITEDNTRFELDLIQAFPNIDFQLYQQNTKTETYRYVRQGGGDLYTFVKLSVAPNTQEVLIIQENLKGELKELYDGNTTKKACLEWMQVYPYIMRAIVDFCLENKLIGLSFTIEEVRFHPVDYRDFAYYICTKKLLEKIILVL